MSAHGEVLVAIINNRHDFAIAREQRWYRIPARCVALGKCNAPDEG